MERCEEKMTISYVAKKTLKEINILFWVTMGIFFLGFCFGRVAHANNTEEIDVINFPTKQTEVLFRNDYSLMKSIYKVFPSHKKNIKKLHIFITTTELNAYTSINQDGSFQISCPMDRGIWVHELLHYFSNQLDVSDSFEFCHEVLENYINGMSAETYKKYYSYNNGSIYKDRQK